MPIYYPFNMFNGGEIAPMMWGRFDQPRYQSGAYLMRNAVPLPQGGWTRRPGLVHCGQTKEQAVDAPVLLVSFVFGVRDTRHLEFGPGYMRVWRSNGVPQTVAGGAPYEIATPYIAADLPGLRFAQSADVVFVASENHPPAKISRYGDTDWRYAAISFTPPIAAPGQPSLAVGGSVPGSGSQTYSYVVTAIDPVTGAMSAPSTARDLNASTLSTTYYIDIAWSAVAGVTEYHVYRKKAGVYGFIGRALGGETTFRDNNISPDTADTPPNIKTPFVGEGNYPRLVFFHQQRLGWAGTRNRPLTFWLSQSANFESLAASVPPKDDDAIEATLAGQQANKVLWVKPDRDVLCIGTEGGVYLMRPINSGVLTPGNVSFPLQSDTGGMELPALGAGQSVLFIRRGGGAAFGMNYNYNADQYDPVELSILANHLLQRSPAKAWAWQQSPHGIVWVVQDDGGLCAMTYLKAHDVIAWHRHDTDGVVEHVSCLPSPDGDQDLLWCVVRRTVGGVQRRYVEIMHPWFDSLDKETAFFVDSGKSYIGEPVTEVSGLEHLEGRTVGIFADGAVFPAQVVTGGQVTLPQPVRVAHVGLTYESEVHPTRPEIGTNNGSSLMRPRRITAAKLRIYQTLGLTVSLLGGFFGEQQAGGNLMATPVELLPTWTEFGDLSVPLAGGWQEDARLVLKVAGPTPATVLAMVLVMDITPEGGAVQ